MPLSVAFGNPDLLQEIGEGDVLKALGAERQYRNDEQIDDSLRSVLFQVPKPDAPDPAVCTSPMVNPRLLHRRAGPRRDRHRARARSRHAVVQLDLRSAYGLAPKGSFTASPARRPTSFPDDPELDPSDPGLRSRQPRLRHAVRPRGRPLTPGSDEAAEGAVFGIRRTTLAARLKSVYGDVDKLDALHRHDVRAAPAPVPSSASCSSRSGHASSAPCATEIVSSTCTIPSSTGSHRRYGVSFKHTLAQLIELNTGVVTAPNVFKVPPSAD